MNGFQFDIQRFAVLLIPMLLGIICHEVAHGWAASRQGDNTASMLGRLSLNPRKHLDATGSLFFLLTFFSGSPVVLGWAKPVPINPRRFRHYRQGMILVSVAGPAANFLLAFVFGLCLLLYIKLAPQPFIEGTTGAFLLRMFLAGVSINVTLAWFNLVPIPPLDGSKILSNLLPPRLGMAYDSLGRYGFFLLIILMFLGLFKWILIPLVSFTMRLYMTILGMPFFAQLF